MTDLKLDDNLQPIFKTEKDYATIDGREKFEQWVRLNAKERLYGISARYDPDSIENKIRLEINRIARESDFINSVQYIEITNLSAEAGDNRSGYKVDIGYNESENLLELIEGL